MALPKPPSLRCLRPFSTTLHTQKPTTRSKAPRSTQSQAPRYTKGPPPYPYGPALHYKQADSGLYGGAHIQFGNKVSEKNALKSRRVWRPNIHNKRLWSDGLGRFVQVKVQARVLRTIDKCGGLDEYLLGDKPERIKELGVEGWRLRWLVMRTGKVRRRLRAERVALGLVGRGIATTEKRVEEKKPEMVESAGADALEDEVERASGEVVERVEGASAGPTGLSEAEGKPGRLEHSVETPSSEPTALEDRITRATQAIEAEAVAARRASSPNDEPEDKPTELPGRRYTKGEKRAWRAEQALKRLAIDPAKKVEVAEGESAMTAEVASIEEAVGAEMEDAGDDWRKRLETAMELLRSASKELKRVKAEAEAPEKEKMEKEKAGEGGVWGKIKGFLRIR